jgi:hypothetical protein
MLSMSFPYGVEVFNARVAEMNPILCLLESSNIMEKSNNDRESWLILWTTTMSARIVLGWWNSSWRAGLSRYLGANVVLRQSLLNVKAVDILFQIVVVGLWHG